MRAVSGLAQALKGTDAKVLGDRVLIVMSPTNDIKIEHLLGDVDGTMSEGIEIVYFSGKINAYASPADAETIRRECDIGDQLPVEAENVQKLLNYWSVLDSCEGRVVVAMREAVAMRLTENDVEELFDTVVYVNYEESNRRDACVDVVRNDAGKTVTDYRVIFPD